MKIYLFLLVCVVTVVGVFYLETPAPRYEDYWSKPDSSEAQTRAYLYGECGFVEKEAFGAGHDQQWLVAFANAEECMLKHGFLYTDSPKGGWGKCDQKVYRDFVSCRSIR
jgi:hypothetical protein